MTRRENALDLSGRKVARDERKAAMLADLRECGNERLLSLRDKVLGTIEYLNAGHARQLANGLPVTDETRRRNLSRPQLELECLNAVLAERGFQS